jgi:hypothetical protein
MLLSHCIEPALVSPPPALPAAPVFGFSPRLAVNHSNGDTFIAVGSSVLVFDASHSRVLARLRIFPHGCISYIFHSYNCLVAASGCRICVWTDDARAQGAEPQIVRCGNSRVLTCAYATTTMHPLVALLQGGGCRGSGAVVHFSASCDARLVAAMVVDAPAWPSRTGGMCSCACIVVEDESRSSRFICASGVCSCFRA